MKNSSLSKKEKKNLTRIIVALVLFLALFITDKIMPLGEVLKIRQAWVLPFCLYLAVYLLIGYDVLWRAVRNIAHGQIFDENFLMCVATLGAFALAIYRGVTGMKIEGFDEACAVLLFYQVGEFFQSYATGRSRRSIAGLMDIRPDYANLLCGDKTERVDPDKVEIGDEIVVNPGEKVPLDGIVVDGETALDTKALTGESMPVSVSEGGEVISGSVNISSRITIKVTKKFYDSTVSKILELVENASDQKSRAENFITRFARYYTPIVVVTAALLAIVPGLATSDWSKWIYRALSFLVVSCPCALVISVPLSFFAGIGAASKYGILIKGSNYLEKFNKADIFVFDKTGTLTKGSFAVSEISPENRRDEILRLAAICENGSSHPIARCIAAAYGKAPESGYSQTNVAGKGIVARREDSEILCGNEKLMAEYGVDFVKSDRVGTIVYIAENRRFVGWVAVEDEIKPEAPEVTKKLSDMGCKTVMLTGDNAAIAESVAKRLALSEYKASLLPQKKVEETEKLLAQKKPGEQLCFVGDGINDAPVLMRSDVGIAMGGVGSDAAIEASDIVLMKDDLRGIPLAKRIAKKTMNIVMQNIVFSIAVKVIILILSMLGITNMWFAVFGDVGVAILAILNAMRVNSSYKGGETVHEKIKAAE